MKTLGFILIILSFLIIVILFSKIKIKLYKRGSGKLELDIYFFFIIHKHIDLTKLVNLYIKDHNPQENVNIVISNIRLFINNNIIIEKYLKKITIKKIFITTGYNTENPLFYPYLTILNWSILSSIKSLVNRFFKKVKNEYYQVLMNDESKTGINLDILASVGVYNLLYVSITNFKELIKLIKYLKKGKENGKYQTNQSAITNSNGLSERVN